MIVAPIELAGPWQAETSLCVKRQEPQVVGFHLRLFTERMDHGEYLRNADALLTSGNRQGWFSNGYRNFEFDGRRLVLHVHSKFWPWQDDLALDVQFNQAAGKWSGSVTCNGEVRSIMLSRPHGEVSTSLSPLTGDWAGRSDVYGFVGCLHSAVQKNGEFILWIDRRSGGYSVYGERLTLSGDLHGNELRFFRDPSPIGNDRSFAGVLSRSAARIDDDWSSPMKAPPLVFRRVEDGTCSLANSH